MDEGIASFRVSFASEAPVDEAMPAQDGSRTRSIGSATGSTPFLHVDGHVSSLDQDDEFSQLHFA
ncbi:hypothetical protein KTD30_21620 [Burkholderia multivorans]|uniref:hypothetical protein n=1 Tax=Burkholderia multivorans TaxID=87883 RepID=UPI001C23B167|nr:hypothetical protein [Burkholderia multivorans]MBU9299757.1 hypothetical protein [Burkholderia multivorans]